MTSGADSHGVTQPAVVVLAITTKFTSSPEQWVNRLVRLHNAQLPESLAAYYEGEQPLSYMHPDLLRRMDSRLQSVVINWPQLVVDSLDERLDVTGFRLGGEQAADQELWRIWQANRLDLHSEQLHIDALAPGRAYAIVGTNEDDPSTPLVTVESPMEVHVDLDPRTQGPGRVETAVRAGQLRLHRGLPHAPSAQRDPVVQQRQRRRHLVRDRPRRAWHGRSPRRPDHQPPAHPGGAAPHPRGSAARS